MYTKITTLNDCLSYDTNIFYGFNNVTECIGSGEADFCDKVLNLSNKLVWTYKKGKKILDNINRSCHHCYSPNTIKHGTTNRTLRFDDGTVETIFVQRRKCKHCGKTFQTDLKDVIDDNANITHKLKDTATVLYQEGHVRLRPIVNSITQLGKPPICPQTVQNIVKQKEIEIKIDPFMTSGYLAFDVQWILPGENWIYRFALFDTTNNIPIAEKIYLEETTETVTEFLTKNTRNIDVKCIITDLDPKYKPIIEKLGYKHQYCSFHAKMNINKKLKPNTERNKRNKEYQKIHKKLKKDLYEVLDNPNYRESVQKLNEIIENIENYNRSISKFILKKLQPYFKTFKQWTFDSKIDKTNNKLENYFHVTYPKADKRKERTIQGVLTKLNHRKQQWFRNNSKL